MNKFEKGYASRHISYGVDGATFERSCPKCGRVVKADDTINISELGGPKEPNATCSQCGRVGMPFEGYI